MSKGEKQNTLGLIVGIVLWLLRPEPYIILVALCIVWFFAIRIL